MQKLGLQSSQIKKLKENRGALQLSGSMFSHCIVFSFILKVFKICSVLPPPPKCFYKPQLQIVFLYRTYALCKNNARAPEVIKHILPLSGGWKQNRFGLYYFNFLAKKVLFFS